MRILLDIDGVMVPANSWKPVELLADGFAAFSSRAVSNLQRIISETGATIVLTTSHKSNYSIAEWENIFSSRGIVAKIEKLNYNSDNVSRRDEILNWLSSRQYPEDFVIIDDNTSLNNLPIQIKKKLILTSPVVGLNEYDATTAIELLHSSGTIHA